MKENVIEAVAVQGTETEIQESDITIENQKVYTFRKLEASDMFLMFNILGKIGINEFSECVGKDMVQQLLNGKNNVTNVVQSVGIAVTLEIVNVVLRNLPKCEKEIYQMLANTSNLTIDEVKKLEFATFMEMVIDFVKKDEFKDFIKVVSKLFK